MTDGTIIRTMIKIYSSKKRLPISVIQNSCQDKYWTLPTTRSNLIWYLDGDRNCPPAPCLSPTVTLMCKCYLLTFQTTTDSKLNILALVTQTLSNSISNTNMHGVIVLGIHVASRRWGKQWEGWDKPAEIPVLMWLQATFVFSPNFKEEI